MTRDISMFIELRKHKSGKMTFGDNGCSNILGIGKIGKNSASSMENVYLVHQYYNNPNS